MNALQEKRITSANLKVIALVCMTIDHFGHTFVYPMVYINPSLADFYYLCRTIGRIAFPLYAFMIAEGCRHTKNIKKYFLQLAIFAAVSELPYNLAYGNTLWNTKSQNVYFTLFLGLAACYVVRLLKESGKNILWSAPIAALLCASGYYLASDYLWYGVLFIWLCAITQDQKIGIRIPLLVLGLIIIAKPWLIVENDFKFSYIYSSCRQLCGSLIALCLILSYNGQRGNLKINKYFFYAYYPAHLLLLAVAADLLL